MVQPRLNALVAAAAMTAAAGAGGCTTDPASRTGSVPGKEAPVSEAAPSAAADKGSESGGPGALPPLVVDTESPLLLDESQEVAAPDPGNGVADNAACLHCHVNFNGEPLVNSHAANGVGCVACHGNSFAHRNDENNVTPPDVMYAADRVDECCSACHEQHDLSAPMTATAEGGPEAELSGETHCTDCHGKHRLEVRTVRWDKITRELSSPK
jgi:hypothetical protein